MENGYSKKGLFGTINHYDSSGKKVGQSRPGFFGSYIHYDENGNKVGYSKKSFFNGYNIMIKTDKKVDIHLLACLIVLIIMIIKEEKQV